MNSVWSSLRWYGLYWQTRMGWSAIAASLLLLLSLLGALFYLRPAMALQSQLRAQLDQQAGQAPHHAADHDTASDDSLPDSAALPAQTQLAEQLAHLHALADTHEIAMGRVDYRLSSLDEAQLQQYQISYTLSSDYPTLRMYLAELLHTLPNAALLGIDLQRFNDGAQMVDAQLRLALYFENAP